MNQWTTNPCTGVCPSCGESNESAPKGRRNCRPCLNRQRLEAKRRNPEKWKRQSAQDYQRNERSRYDRYLRRKYGITADDYDRMFAEQNGKCAVCLSTDTGRGPGKRFHVDHCHTTGVVRSLLCCNCNVGIGNFKEDPRIMMRAMSYVAGARLKELGLTFDAESTATELPSPSEASPSD